MEKIFKITLTLFVCVAMSVLLSSCSKDGDEPEVKIPVTQTEIQGSWHLIAFGYYHLFSFSGSNYTYYIMDAKTKIGRHQH